MFLCHKNNTQHKRGQLQKFSRENLAIMSLLLDQFVVGNFLPGKTDTSALPPLWRVRGYITCHRSNDRSYQICGFYWFFWRFGPRPVSFPHTLVILHIRTFGAPRRVDWYPSRQILTERSRDFARFAEFDSGCRSPHHRGITR